LLGEDRRADRARSARAEAERVAYAQGVLDITAGSRDPGSEVLSAGDLLDASELALRHEDPDYRTMAERAAANRTWTFGHVIVDEAQELSAMAWRLLARRCPARSMTIVGDVA
jgi:DNA helicase IV